MSVSTFPAMAVPVTSISPSCPPLGVLFTVKALFGRLAAAARSSVKVIASAVPSTEAEATVGAVLSMTYWCSLSALGVVLPSALSALSLMSWAFANASVRVPSYAARSAPLAVTSYSDSEPLAALAATVAVTVGAPVTVKSALPTFFTSSLKVTRHVTVSALVGDVAGVRRAIDSTVGGTSSMIVTAWSVKSASSFPAESTISAPLGLV